MSISSLLRGFSTNLCLIASRTLRINFSPQHTKRPQFATFFVEKMGLPSTHFLAYEYFELTPWFFNQFVLNR
jgi:hypothetical protein